MRRARRLSRTSAAQFAELLRGRLEEEGQAAECDVVTPAAVRDWEAGITVPSALVLLAAADVAGVELEVLLCRRPIWDRLRELEQGFKRQSQQLLELQLGPGRR